MKISTKAGYGLRACFILSLHEGEVLSVADIVKCTAISQKYLERILCTLSKDGIVTAKRGANGGYTLAKPASEISVGEIFRSLEDNLEITDCIGGVCNDQYCPNRNLMQKLYAHINELLDGYSLKDLLKDNTCYEA